MLLKRHRHLRAARNSTFNWTGALRSLCTTHVYTQTWICTQVLIRVWSQSGRYDSFKHIFTSIGFSFAILVSDYLNASVIQNKSIKKRKESHTNRRQDKSQHCSIGGRTPTSTQAYGASLGDGRKEECPLNRKRRKTKEWEVKRKEFDRHRSEQQWSRWAPERSVKVRRGHENSV